MENLNQHINFIMELDRLKAVQRRCRIKCDDNRFENSAEHSWHIALMAQVLSVYADEPVNLDRVVTMLLIHDIVEIDAGDTFAFDMAGQESTAEVEAKAADRIFGLLPEPQAKSYRALWQEFEEAQTADGRFAKAMDRLLPLLQNCRNEGGSWLEHGVSRSQVIKRNEYLKGSVPRLWDYAVQEIDQATDKGWLVKD